MKVRKREMSHPGLEFTCCLKCFLTARQANHLGKGCFTYKIAL
jgi:hypothetical protein